jgi:hypothetical protein
MKRSDPISGGKGSADLGESTGTVSKAMDYVKDKMPEMSSDKSTLQQIKDWASS